MVRKNCKNCKNCGKFMNDSHECKDHVRKGKTNAEFYGKKKAVNIEKKRIKSFNLAVKEGRHNSWLKGKSKDSIEIKRHIENVKLNHWSKKEKRKEVIEKLSKTRCKNIKNGKIKVWSKGLKKENNESLMRGSKKLTGRDHLKLEKNPNWQGGLSFKEYDKRWNLKFKKMIRARDNQICMMCFIHREKLKTALDVHHINYDKQMTIPENCISLCKNCHRKTNFNRDKWTSFFYPILHEKYGYIYEDNKIVVEVKYENQ